ncbi:tyrosine-type recombinase/integrase [Jeotgalibacillus sp. ET6]|uniref:site-specific tyrosine recombinase/integron integrase n=1 Tax=Jeotgalibacillus sp. ET6 TaxID=3037260 RepID=UPI0024183F21|nr:site-specific tyrosine recombinase/integron integrase [Jeotgalibacillus sp. ET6]MDG5473693.1 tyrosine-type recombinase/integrase [Jeotgalibacillus sp. ET6]
MNQKVIQEFFLDNFNQFSPETIRAYNIALSQFFAVCPKNYDEVHARDIRNWLETMNQEGLQPRSIRLKLSALKSFYRYCIEENKITKNPTKKVNTPKKVDSLPRYLTKRQLAMLQEYSMNDPRDRAIIEILYATGVRINELLQVRLEDIKWDTRQIWIRKGKGNKARFVLFSHSCAERLKRYLDTRSYGSEYLFSNAKGKPISDKLVQLKFREYSETLGFKVSPHTLRHTFAANLADKGMDFSYIQELLGHSNINSTRIYIRLRNHERKKQYDQYQQ